MDEKRVKFCFKISFAFCHCGNHSLLLPFLLWLAKSGSRTLFEDYLYKLVANEAADKFPASLPRPFFRKTAPPKWLNICVLSLTRVMRLNGVFNENKVYLDNLLLLHDIIGCHSSSKLPHDADCNFQHRTLLVSSSLLLPFSLSSYFFSAVSTRMCTVLLAIIVVVSYCAEHCQCRRYTPTWRKIEKL